jgi:hypothetical protein
MSGIHNVSGDRHGWHERDRDIVLRQNSCPKKNPQKAKKKNKTKQSQEKTLLIK